MTASVAAVSSVVLKHLPESGRLEGGESSAAMYSRFILIASRMEAEFSGRSRDADDLKELEKSLAASLRILEKLGRPTTKRLWFYSRTPLEMEDDNNPFALEDMIRRTREAVHRMRTMSLYRKQARPNTNWVAIAVVEECRRVWAMETVRASPGKYLGYSPLDPANFQGLNMTPAECELNNKERNSYFDFVESFAPTSQNHNRPGPFGRFVEEVFGELGIVAADGAPVSCGTALAALMRLKRQ